ncbi:MAG: hypothetical protein Aureis2KO_04790 [Aureisphaera sp.]
MKRLTHLFIIIILLAGSVQISAGNHNEVSEKFYEKAYYSNGQLKAEGWQFMNVKTDYWIYYHRNGNIASKGHYSNNRKNGYWYYYDENGQLTKEGHYKHGSAENWWIFYDIANQKTNKFQYKNNKKNGFCLRYNKKKLIKAERYKNDQKDGEWTSISSFRRDNPGASLR